MASWYGDEQLMLMENNILHVNKNGNGYDKINFNGKLDYFKLF